MDGDREDRRTAGLRKAVATLDPGYFALVMATGILSVAVLNHGLSALSAALLWLGVACHLVLAVLIGLKAVLFTGELRADLGDPCRAFGFLTIVAGTDVLGVRFALGGHRTTALVLLVAGCVSWLVLGYVVPWSALGPTRRPVLAGANGNWFVWPVAGQSVAVLAAALEPTISTGRRVLALLAVFSWSLGVFLYAAMGIFVTARLLAHPIRPADLTASYWVAMGATAITVLAGAHIAVMADASATHATRSLIAAASVVFWCFGSWLIPALVAAGWWRHVTHRLPLRYNAVVWSAIFPLGMYGVAAHDIGRVEHLPIVRAIGDGETWLALAAWALAFAALLMHLSRGLYARTGGR